MKTLQPVVDSALLPIFVINEAGYYVYENRAAEALLGYDPAEVISKRVTDLVAVEPDLVLSGFARIKLNGYGKGRAPFRLKNGGLIKADANVFVRTLIDGTRVTVSLLHQVHENTGDAPIYREPVEPLRLTGGQVNLLQLLVDGFSDEQVADLLGVRLSTFAEQIKEVRQSLNVQSRTEACIVALKTRAVV